MTKQEAQTMRAAVRHLVEAEVSFSWRGICEPAEMHEIERERDLASEEYEMLLDALTEESNHA